MKRRTINNEKGPGRQSRAFKKNTINASKFSTGTEAQERRILAALHRGPKTTDQLRALGCYQPAARIWGLRTKGWPTVTELFNGYGADGLEHSRLALYSLPGIASGGNARRSRVAKVC